MFECLFILATTSFLIVLLMYCPPTHSRGIPQTRNSSTTWSGLSGTSDGIYDPTVELEQQCLDVGTSNVCVCACVHVCVFVRVCVCE